MYSLTKSSVFQPAPAAASSEGSQYLDAIQAALKAESKGSPFEYTERDATLYNLGVGAKRTDLKYV